jgi:hypothetical protein
MDCVEEENAIHLMVERKKSIQDSARARYTIQKEMPSVTYFLQLGATFHLSIIC